jgi:hypothetical protein
MKKFYGYIFLVGLLIMVIGCSSGVERASAVKSLGFEIAFQNSKDDGVNNDWFIGIKDKNVYYIKVDAEGDVGQIIMIMELGGCEIIALPENNQYETKPIIKSDKY